MPGRSRLDRLEAPTAAEMRQASGVAARAAREWDRYVRSCHRKFKVIRPLMRELFGAGLDGRVVLDWGCATGGVAMLVKDALPVQVHAADVDAHSIAWLSRTAPDIACAALRPGEALPYEDAKFDCIYGISVLTHIPPEGQEFYLRELARVSRPGGAVIVTVKGYAACERNAALERAELEARGIIHTPYPEAILQSMDFARSGGYGITYHSPGYVAEVFGRHFDVQRIDERGWSYQDVVILRKRSGSPPAER
jgi:ubiquinone/menaquinone biosynthesis C-methylase UbiE